MHNSLKSTIIAASIYLSLMAFSSHALAALSCDPQGYSSIIGSEVVAVQCIPDGMNDSTAIYYRYRDYECIGGVVTKTAEGNTVLNTPNGIQYPSNGMGSYFRHFRNKEGSYFFEVSTWYRGTIDGKSMSLGAYPGGGVYIDVFTQIIDMASLPTVPDCKGKDPDNCKLNKPSASTVNMGNGQLSHSQEVFSLDNNRSLALGVTLYYRSSSPFAPSTIGEGWSHNYEATLVAGSGNAMVLWNQGGRKIYEKYNSTYVAPKGDTSTLVKNGDNTWTISELDGLKRNFDTVGKLTSIINRYNNALTFAYNVAGRLESVTDSTGRFVTFTYNPTSGKLETITEPETSRVHTLAYPSGKLDTVTPPGNKGQWVYTYGTNGLLATKKDPENNQSSYTYYADNRLKDATDPLTKKRDYAYPSPVGNAGKIPDAYPPQVVPIKQFNFTEKDGFGWTYTYDTLTLAERTATDPNGKVTTSYYNADGTMRAKTIPYNGTVKLTTFYTYDSNGNLLTETDPVDISTYTPAIDPQTVDIASLSSRTPPIKTAMSYTYDTAVNFYQIKTITDNRGATALTTTIDRYTEPDGLGGTWLVTRTTAPGETAGIYLISYQRQNANGSLASTTDANGRTTSYSYYPVDDTTKANGTAGMLQTMTTPDGIKLTYTAYDKNGNASEYKTTDSTSTDVPVKTTQSYSSQNRLTSILKESTIQPARFPANLTQYDYDKNGNRSLVIDAESNPTTLKYTYQGQLAEIIDASGKSTKFDYSGTGCTSCSSGVDKLTAVRDANHIANNQPGTVYTYDKVGRLETETDPLNKKLRYTYYDNGLLKEKFDTTAGEPGTLLVTHLYNARGQLTDKLYADNTSAHFTYDANARLETASNLSGATTTFSYTYAYHTNGRLKSVTDSNGRKITYDEYDANGQRKKITFSSTVPADQRIITYDYDTANRPWHIYAPAGTFITTYDERGRKKKVTYPNGTQTDYDYDDLDRLTLLNHSVTGGSTIVANGYPGHDQVGNIKTRSGDFPATYLYDPLYRLTDANSPRGAEKFAYDDVGNRTHGPGTKDVSSTYSHNAANQMITGRMLTYVYDNFGNQTQRIINNAPDKNWMLEWDKENRLIKVEKGKGTTEKRTTTFKYDPQGRRIEKKHVTLKDSVTKTTTITYVYDNEDIFLEIEDDGTAVTKTFYTHGPGVDEPLALERSGNFYYYHTDHLGSVMAITDANKMAVQRYTYDAFGLPKATTSFKNGYQFTGREFDPQTGLYYYRARYYDPLLGRFIQKDPIGFDGGINVYAYTFNNPIRFTDPFGLDSAGCDNVPGFLETPCRLECCAKHDECYDKNKCTWSSWFKDSPGNKCNQDVFDCFKKCGSIKKDDPNKPNYFCAKLHRYINIPGDFLTVDAAVKACKSN